MSTHQTDLVKDLAEADAAAVMALGVAVRVPSGGELFKLGAEATSLYVIERGRISLTLPLQLQGRDEDILIEERLPGQTVGWSALIPPHRFTLKATAQLETELLAFSRAALLEYFKVHPLVGYVMTHNLASVVGQRLQVFQAMWLREMQRVVELRAL
ncbi:MAG: cyclic nucleotide-binding domain-containing protein [Acidobacteriota bacterium]